MASKNPNLTWTSETYVGKVSNVDLYLSFGYSQLSHGESGFVFNYDIALRMPNQQTQNRCAIQIYYTTDKDSTKRYFVTNKTIKWYKPGEGGWQSFPRGIYNLTGGHNGSNVNCYGPSIATLLMNGVNYNATTLNLVIEFQDTGYSTSWNNNKSIATKKVTLTFKPYYTSPQYPTLKIKDNLNNTFTQTIIAGKGGINNNSNGCYIGRTVAFEQGSDYSEFSTTAQKDEQVLFLQNFNKFDDNNPSDASVSIFGQTRGVQGDSSGNIWLPVEKVKYFKKPCDIVIKQNYDMGDNNVFLQYYIEDAFNNPWTFLHYDLSIDGKFFKSDNVKRLNNNKDISIIVPLTPECDKKNMQISVYTINEKKEKVYIKDTLVDVSKSNTITTNIPSVRYYGRPVVFNRDALNVFYNDVEHPSKNPTKRTKFIFDWSGVFKEGLGNPIIGFDYIVIVRRGQNFVTTIADTTSQTRCEYSNEDFGGILQKGDNIIFSVSAYSYNGQTSKQKLSTEYVGQNKDIVLKNNAVVQICTGNDMNGNPVWEHGILYVNYNGIWQEAETVYTKVHKQGGPDKWTQIQ